MIVVISGSCKATTEEARRTGAICFKLIRTLGKCDKRDSLRDELLLLARQASMEHLHFSAAGFFNSDYTMLYNLMNVIMGYIVIVFQFKK